MDPIAGTSALVLTSSNEQQFKQEKVLVITRAKPLSGGGVLHFPTM
jgi:hypothetical protein